MFSKLSLSIRAAPLLSAFGGVARAAPVPANSDSALAESGNPDSTEYSKRMFSPHSPTNDEINAAETGNPCSVDFRYSNQPSSGSGDLAALETESPDNPRPDRRLASAGRMAGESGGSRSGARQPSAVQR
jgi:hypothetical protein